MFISFHGNNELHIENATKEFMDELRREVFGMWPDGVVLDELPEKTHWRVRFRNAPWSLREKNLKWTGKMLVRLFEFCEEQGLACATSDIQRADTRLSFVASRRYTSSFFLATFSNKGQTFTMIDPPKEVFRQTYLPRQTSRYDTITKELSTLSLVGNSKIYQRQLLRALDEKGYTVYATLPMARRLGPFSALGLGTKQELIAFKITGSSVPC